MKKLTVKKDVDCKACLACVRACSEAFYKVFDQDKSCIQIIEKNGVVKLQVCIQCGKCAKACRMDVDVTKTPDHTECIRCGMCVKACPVEAVSFRCGFAKKQRNKKK